MGLRRRRVFVMVLSAMLLMVAIAVVVVHLPPVQRAVWERVVTAVDEATGWRVAADHARFRLWPARAEAGELVVSGPDGTFLSIAHVRVRWSWWRLLGSHRRLELLAIDNLELDLRALSLPEAEPAAGPAPDPWSLLEIATLRVTDSGLSHEQFGVGIEADGLELTGSLVDGAVELAVRSRELAAFRDGRRLGAGPFEVRASATREHVEIGHLSLDGAPLSARATGELGLGGEPVGGLRLELGADLGVIAAWWDPNLASGLEPAGRLELRGEIVRRSDGELEAHLEHRGAPLSVARFPIEELRLDYGPAGPAAEVSATAWGRASVVLGDEGAADISLALDQAQVDRLLAFAAPEAAAVITGPVTVSGDIEATASFPVNFETLAARFDVEGEWRDGSVLAVGHGQGASWTLERLTADAFGVGLSASGALAEDGVLAAELEVAVAAPRETASALATRFAGVELPEIAGGPLQVTATLGGTVAQPSGRITGSWERPEISGRVFERAVVTADGTFDDLRWSAEAVAVPGARVIADGAAAIDERRVSGSWNLTVEELAPLVDAALALGDPQGVQGRLEGEGTFEVAPTSVKATAAITGRGLVAAGWTIDSLRLGITADQEEVELRDLEVDAMGGRLEGSAALNLVDRRLEAALGWRDLDLTTLPIALPSAALGRSSGRVVATGPLERPEAVVELTWQSTGPDALVERAVLHAEVADGTVEIASEELVTAFGDVEITASVPLGGFGLPAGLWPDAPDGAAHATLRLSDFNSMALVEALETADPGLHATADLAAELWWDPQRPEGIRARARADGLRVSVPGGALEGDGPLEIELDGGRLEIPPFVLEGIGSRLQLDAAYIPASEQLAARVHATVSPQLARVVPLPLRLRGPLVVDAQLHAPVSAGLAPEEVRGSLMVDHRGGSMVMRDPAVEVRDLQLTARLTDRGLDIVEGSAVVNEGRVELGGGWDPQSGQGIVVDIENVAFLVEGILTAWDGQLAVEPLAGRTAKVAGDLALRRGVWEENVDLAAVLLGGDDLQMAVDDPLRDISLDLAVHGRTGIEVENNLGRFNASWNTLRIAGSAAEPRIRGEIRIAPGGMLALGGQDIKVGRGSLRFTGDPSIDPVLEIVPESDLALLEGFDPTVAATRSLAQGITSALGFENTTLQPAEIAVQTEKDPSARFLVGRRLSRNLALFFATDLSNVQDRTTMLQAWNFPWLSGLIVQGYQETLNDETGGNVLQRFRWGGTEVLSDRPQIFKVRLEGDWPLGVRTLRRATGLRRGQPYDPFLLFVASVRLERELAAAGYQEAVVDARAEGSERSPTLVFTCDPGPRVVVEFAGFEPGRALRREATALYSPPPRESAALEEIRAVVIRQLASLNFPSATASVSRSGDVVRVEVDPGEKLELRGPVLEGLPAGGQELLGQTLRSPAALAAMLRRPEWAARAVQRELAAHGYLDADVRAVEQVPLESGAAEVRVLVDPGPRAVVAEVSVAGEDPLGLVADGVLQVHRGDPLDRQAIEHAVRMLRDRYEDRGYRSSSAQWSLRQNGDGGWVLEVTLAPGERRVLREVEFEGLRHTSPRVLSSGLTVVPGELVTDRDIDVSASDIANFDRVERVDVRAKPVGTSEVDLQFDVTEKPRWRAEVGGGWSSERGASATFGIRDDGLLGRGIGLNLRGSWSSPDRRIFLVGSIPTTPGGRLSFISTLGYREGDDVDEPELLAQEEVLASLEAQYLLRGNAQVGLYYRWTDTRTYEKNPDPFNPVPLDTTLGLGILGTRLVVDHFDDLFDPRSGWGLTTDLGWSSTALASDVDYLTSLSSFTLALEPFRGATWMQSLRLGVAEPLKGQNLIPEARFKAGGQSSLRGFDLDSVGPTTLGIDFSIVPAGGGALFILNEELRIPVWGSLRGAVFADVGQVWESWSDADLELSVGVGVGIRWSTPIGPLWADVAWPVANVGISSDKPKFYLGIGRPF